MIWGIHYFTTKLKTKIDVIPRGCFNILFVPTENIYCLITVIFGNINMADADERWGSQKKHTELLTSSQTEKRPSPVINISEKKKTNISTFENSPTTLKHSVSLSSIITHDHTYPSVKKEASIHFNTKISKVQADETETNNIINDIV